MITTYISAEFLFLMKDEKLNLKNDTTNSLRNRSLIHDYDVAAVQRSSREPGKFIFTKYKQNQKQK